MLSLGRSLLKETVDVTLPLRPTAPLGELFARVASLVYDNCWQRKETVDVTLLLRPTAPLGEPSQWFGEWQLWAGQEGHGCPSVAAPHRAPGELFA